MISTEKRYTLLFSHELWTLLVAQDLGVVFYYFHLFRPVHLVLLIGDGAQGAKAEARSPGKGWIARSSMLSDEDGVQWLRVILYY